MRTTYLAHICRRQSAPSRHKWTSSCEAHKLRCSHTGYYRSDQRLHTYSNTQTSAFLPRDAKQSAVMGWQVVCLSVHLW